MSALVYPKFIGRLANNMFQIAACIGYAKKYGVKWGIKKGYVEKGFNANQVDRFMPDLPYCGGNFRRYAEHQLGRDETWFNYHEIPFFPEGVELCGFFQSEKYFENAKNEVKSTFGEYVRWRNLPNYCSIHVRRGDYTQHSGSFPPVPVDYIQQAIHHMLIRDVNKFMIFSDDQKWCMDNIPLSNDYSLNFSQCDEWDDFSSMASCDHHIIANSTFSWWAAYLGRNPNKVVITPSAETWFGPEAGPQHPVYDLIPEGWIQIHTRNIDLVNVNENGNTQDN